MNKKCAQSTMIVHNTNIAMQMTIVKIMTTEIKLIFCNIQVNIYSVSIFFN